ncbi:MAG: Nif3-like dinuclear metal center hexameric protein [Deltaproteobacteria bacterium]|nr:Nif3-like dinuclear metal center hexameric protein [Deltaproteobacteria bacterium]
MKIKTQIQHLLTYLNQFAPPSLAEDWDNIGLQLGSLEDEIRGILIALDVTESVLEEAKRLKTNVLITHHPLFFKAIKSLDDSKSVQRLAKMAIKQDLNILSFHTNLDATLQGLNDLLAERLKLKFIHPFIPSRDPKIPYAGLGRIGNIQKMNFNHFLTHVSQSLHLKHFRYVGDLRASISTVAVMTGSGGDFFWEAKRKKADVLVTGDVKYHSALDSLAEEICLVDIGHFAGEIGMTTLMGAQIRNFLKKQKVLVPVFETKCQRDPFEFFGGME